ARRAPPVRVGRRAAADARGGRRRPRHHSRARPTARDARTAGAARGRARPSALPAYLVTARDGFHLVQRRQALQRLDLDLPDAFGGEAQPPSDLLERLRLVAAADPVAQDYHRPLALGQRPQRIRELLGPQRRFDDLVGEGPLAGDEVAEGRVVLGADRLVE